MTLEVSLGEQVAKVVHYKPVHSKLIVAGQVRKVMS
jgi:hypothetical protein